MSVRLPLWPPGVPFRSFFPKAEGCPGCGLPFERASGEITGGMGVNIVATLALVIVAAAVIGFSQVPLMPAFAVMGVLVVLFPILFYPSSRGLWLALLYLTGDNTEPD
nr:MAG: DUF983 domain-containing protein [Chloroflexota bacterium]